MRRGFLISLLLAAAWSCDEIDQDDSIEPNMPGFPNTAYFMEATLELEGSSSAPVPLRWYVDLDPETPTGRNDFRIVAHSAGTEIYSVFNSDSTRLDTSLQGPVFNNYAEYLYGSASYEGVGFCFYQPMPGESSSAGLKLDSLLVPGQLLSIGQQPGDVEVGYFKNHPSAITQPGRGLVTTGSPGYVEIQAVTPAQSGFGENGYQLAVEFDVFLTQQFGLGAGGRLSGQARIFVPNP